MELDLLQDKLERKKNGSKKYFETMKTILFRQKWHLQMQ